MYNKGHGMCYPVCGINIIIKDRVMVLMEFRVQFLLSIQWKGTYGNISSFLGQPDWHMS